MRQVGAALEGRVGEHFQNPLNASDIGFRQVIRHRRRHRRATAQVGHRAHRHQAIDFIDQGTHGHRIGAPWAWQRHQHFVADAAGSAGHDDDAVRHHHGFLDVVRNDQDALGGNAVAVPQVKNIVAQGLAGQHIQRRERFVHQQHVGIGHQCSRNPDALAHAAGQFARQGATKAGQAHQVEHGIGALFAFGRRHALGFQTEFDILLHCQPGKQRERLEHHRHAGGRAVDQITAVHGAAGVRRDQPGHDAQQRRLARARLAQQRHDFAFGQSKIDVIQHQSWGAIGAAERFGDAGQVHQGLVCHGSSAPQCMRSSASAYRRRQKNRFNNITKMHITPMPSVMRRKSPASVICLM